MRADAAGAYMYATGVYAARATTDRSAARARQSHAAAGRAANDRLLCGGRRGQR